MDFTHVLLQSGFALPTAQALDSPQAEKLLSLTLFSPFPSNPAITALGRNIILTHPNYFYLGAELVHSSTDTNDHIWLSSEIKKATPAKLDEYGSASELRRELLYCDYDAAKQFFISLTNRSSAEHQISDQEVELLHVAASSMARWNDLSGFDILVAQTTSLAADDPRRKYVIGILNEFRFLSANIFSGWFNGSEEFLPTWYQEIRPTLHWKSTQGYSGWAINDGDPFDHSYYATMRPYRAILEKRASAPNVQ